MASTRAPRSPLPVVARHGAKQLRVGVVGAGTAGPAAALGLAQAGHHVTLFERVADPGPVGAGIVLQPTGMGALRRLGLLGDALACGHAFDRLHGVTTGGRTVLDLSYGARHRGWFGLGMHRGALFDILWRALEPAGVTVRAGVAVRDVGDGWLAHEQRQDFDLVVVADGARSSLRAKSGLPHSVLPYRWGAVWAVVPDPGGLYSGALAQVYDGTGRFVGFLPTGRAEPGGEELVSLFWSLRMDRWPALREGSLEGWKQDVLRLSPRAAPALEQVRSWDQVTPARYHGVHMPKPHTARTVFLGDAAHATSPQLGQGANLALADAVALVDSVATTPDVPTALPLYARRRRSALAYYRWVTWALTPFFQSDWAPLGWARDLGMGWLCRAPWVSAQMVDSMCGSKTDLFSAQPLPAPPVHERRGAPTRRGAPAPRPGSSRRRPS